MYLYRSRPCSTLQALKSIAKVLPKLGQILSVRGYRFTSTRGTGTDAYTTNHERVIVEGRNGKAIFNGLLWGYSGEGPRGLVTLLRATGLSKLVAEHVAFRTPRLEIDGTDFELEYNVNDSVTYSTFGYKAVLSTQETLIVNVKAA